jgi:protein SCO1/2
MFDAVKVMSRLSWRRIVAVCATAAWIASPVCAVAQRKEPPPPELEKVGITEHLDAPLPLDLPFVDSDGRKVLLRECFDGRRPVILTLNYSDCGGWRGTWVTSTRW